jgi:multidrug resistance protein, MATE family
MTAPNASSAASSGLVFGGDEGAAGEPSIPGSNRRFGLNPVPMGSSRAALDSSSRLAARAWGSDDDDARDGSTEDEDDDRRLVGAAAGPFHSPLADSRSPGAMAKKGALKKVEPSVLVGKENAPLASNLTTNHHDGKPNRGLKQSAADDAAMTQWTSNVAKWQQRDAANVLTPRGSKRKPDQKPSATTTATTTTTTAHARPPVAPLRESSVSASKDDAETCAVQMDPLYQQSKVSSPSVLKPSTSLTTSAMRLMERSPLLRASSSIANDPEWGPRALSELRPDLKDEFRSLCVLSYPVIFTYVLEFLPGIVSMTLVGHMDSPLTKEYVDGVSLSTMFMNLTGVAFGFGLATAMDTLCSQAYGAGKPKKMGIYFQCGVLVLGATVIPVFLLNWYTEQFLLWMGQPSEVAALAGRFSRMILPGIPFLYMYELFKKLLQAQNVVKPMVYIAVISNVVNVILGVYLTWYTSLGYDGAAIARTIANVVLPLALVPYFMCHPEVARQWWPGWKLSQAISHMKTFLTLGIPGMFMMLLEWWAFEIMAAFVGLLPNSVVAISVHSVLSTVSTMTFNFFLGIAVATNIRVGNYVGSNQPEHAKMASVLGTALAFAVSAALALVILVTRNVLPMVFINDATSVTLAAHAFLSLMPYQMLDAVNSVMQGVFRGTGRQTLGAYINLFGYFVVGLPFGVFLAFKWEYGVEGLWLGLTAGIGIGVLLSMYKIYKIDWDEMADAARVRTS